MSARNEPECWTCNHIGGKAERRTCELHKILIPGGQGGALFICADFEHAVHQDIGLDFVLARKEEMKGDTLYTYKFMDKTPPKEFAKFELLRS